jgi:hypothetical protein
VEVRIGVVHATRELSVETSDSAEHVQEALASALADENGVFRLDDERGRSIHVPAAKVAYVEIVSESGRRVGFGGFGG